MTTKEHAAALRDTLRDMAGEEFAHCERAVRDLLFLASPPTVLTRQAEIAHTIRGWFAEGVFYVGKVAHPFQPSVFRDAVAQMWAQPSFAPDGYSGEKLLNYLKKVMLGLLAQKRQRKVEAGMQPAAAPRPDAAASAGAPSWFDAALAALQACDIDLSPVIVLTEIERGMAANGQPTPETVAALNAAIFNHARAIIPAAFEQIVARARDTLRPYALQWGESTYLETLQAAIHADLTRLYRVPILSYDH